LRHGLVVASVTNTMQETQVIKPAHLAPSDLPFRGGHRSRSPRFRRSSSTLASFFPPLYLSLASKALSTGLCSLGPDVLLGLGSLAVWAALTFFLSGPALRWEPESKIPRRAKLLRRRHRNPLSPSGDLGKQYHRTISLRKDV